MRRGFRLNVWHHNLEAFLTKSILFNMWQSTTNQFIINPDVYLKHRLL